MLIFYLASDTVTRLTTAVSPDDPFIQNSGELVGRQIHDRTYFIGIIR